MHENVVIDVLLVLVGPLHALEIQEGPISQEVLQNLNALLLPLLVKGKVQEDLIWVELVDIALDLPQDPVLNGSFLNESIVVEHGLLEQGIDLEDHIFEKEPLPDEVPGLLLMLIGKLSVQCAD